MDTPDKKEDQPANTQPGSYADQEGNDKAPGEERGKEEKVTPEDLKGKKVDADPGDPKDKPLSQL